MRLTIQCTLALLATLGLATGSGYAQAPNPCAYKNIDLNTYSGKDFKNPPVLSSSGGVLKMDLDVKYTDPATTSLGGCPLTLRSFRSTPRTGRQLTTKAVSHGRKDSFISGQLRPW